MSGSVALFVSFTISLSVSLTLRGLEWARILFTFEL
jgi:hypothetical protein